MNTNTTMKSAIRKAKIIKEQTDCDWSEALARAKKVNKVNKTQMIIEATKENPLSIEDAMAMTGLDKNNLQSRFRKDRIFANGVYYDRKYKVFRHVAS